MRRDFHGPCLEIDGDPAAAAGAADLLGALPAGAGAPRADAALAPRHRPVGGRPAPRDRLLLALRRGEVDRSPLAGLSPDDWIEVLDLADRHGVTPALHRSLRSAGVAVPPQIGQRLRETTLAVGARNARALGQVGRLLRGVRAAGVDVAVLKGADLAERIYSEVALRPMADIDLLVRPGDLRRASALLASMGYDPLERLPGDGHQDAIAENLHVEPVRKPGGPLVELHYAIGIPKQVGGIDMEGVWTRMVPGRVGDADTQVLSPEDLLLHLCIHVALHHGFGAKLVQLVDLAAVVDRLGDRIDWEALDRRAREWGVRRGVALTFALAEELLGPFTPPGRAPSLEIDPGEPDPLARAGSLLFQSGGRGVGSANLPLLFGSGTWREKARLMLRRAFPSRQEMAFTYRVAAGSPKLLLLYPRRMWELCRRHGVTLRAIAGGDAVANRVLSMEQERAALVAWMKGRG